MLVFWFLSLLYKYAELSCWFQPIYFAHLQRPAHNLELPTLVSSVDPTTLCTWMNLWVLLNNLLPGGEAYEGALHVALVLTNSLLGGWSADGITLPGVLDIECL